MADFTMWKFCPYCGQQWEPKGLDRQLAKGVVVCGGCGCEWHSSVNPELLEAAKAVVAVLETGAEPIATLDQLEQAIKKAEGNNGK